MYFSQSVAVLRERSREKQKGGYKRTPIGTKPKDWVFLHTLFARMSLALQSPYVCIRQHIINLSLWYFGLEYITLKIKHDIDLRTNKSVSETMFIVHPTTLPEIFKTRAVCNNFSYAGRFSVRFNCPPDVFTFSEDIASQQQLLKGDVWSVEDGYRLLKLILSIDIDICIKT